MAIYRGYGQSQFLLSTETIPRPDYPNRNKLRSNPVTGHLMKLEEVTEGECRVITQPRPNADDRQLEFPVAANYPKPNMFKRLACRRSRIRVVESKNTKNMD